ncbi:MAG: hypothetical protein M5U28_32545 [Sandaracinaceae bacterium]|nr:hypothetical protein [Sandaracinaceae bacterium]
MALSTVLLLNAAGCAQGDAHIDVSERGVALGDRHEVRGCTNEWGYVDGPGPFAVGAEIAVTFDVRRDCVRRSVYGCEAWETGPSRMSVRSTNPEVLVVRSGRGTFVGPGETTLIMQADGVDVASRTLLAEPVAGLDVQIVAQPGLDHDWGTSFSPLLEPADALAILRSGPGARLVVRPLSADGRTLCGRPPLEVVPGEGIEALADERYWRDAPRLGEIFVLTARADAPARARVALAAAGVGADLVIDTAGPEELTHLEITDHALREPSETQHVVDVAVFAGARRVHGASLAFESIEAYDCASASIRGVDGPGSPRDMRFLATSYCGTEAEPWYRVSVAEAPGVGLELAVTR